MLCQPKFFFFRKAIKVKLIFFNFRAWIYGQKLVSVLNYIFDKDFSFGWMSKRKFMCVCANAKCYQLRR